MQPSIRPTIAFMVLTLAPTVASAQTSTCPAPCLKPPKTSVALIQTVSTGATGGDTDVTESVPMDVGKAKTIRIVTATMSAYPPNGTTALLVCSDQSNPPGPYQALAQSESPFSGPCGGGGDQCTVTARYVYDMDDPFNSVVREAKLPMAIECTGVFGPQSGAVSALITIDVVTTKK